MGKEEKLYPLSSFLALKPYRKFLNPTSEIKEVRSQNSESRIQEDYQNNCHTRESGYPVESGFPPTRE
jgi:hypothetical protein